MYRGMKRALDIVLSGMALILLSPLFLVLALVVMLDTPGAIFFVQKRVGREKRYFPMLKFRTMLKDTPRDIPTHEMDHPERWITASGRFLRRTSLDELPQLINVFLGQMSLVGPRPALWNQEDLVLERDKYTGRRGMTANAVRPGLTGWAQINGRDELSIEDKARFDGEYVQKFGFLMDLKCLLGTVAYVLRHEGVVEGGTGKLKQESKGKP